MCLHIGRPSNGKDCRNKEQVDNTKENLSQSSVEDTSPEAREAAAESARCLTDTAMGRPWSAHWTWRRSQEIFQDWVTVFPAEKAGQSGGPRKAKLTLEEDPLCQSCCCSQRQVVSLKLVQSQAVPAAPGPAPECTNSGLP